MEGMRRDGGSSSQTPDHEEGSGGVGGGGLGGEGGGRVCSGGVGCVDFPLPCCLYSRHPPHCSECGGGKKA